MTDAAGELRAAWDDMIAGLQRARDAIDDPSLYPPPVSDRNLAEGYRYLLGFLYSGIERAFFSDAKFPYFRRAIQSFDKSTIDNADAMYLAAVIDGTQSYRIRGRMLEKRPQYVIFEVHKGYAGDSGTIEELKPGAGIRAGTGTLDSSKLVVDEDGAFELLLAPDRPDGHTGNFIPTQRTSTRTGATTVADCVSMRVLFHDWEHEKPLELHIVQLGAEGDHPAPLDPGTAAAQMRRAAELTDNQMRFWNEFYAVVIETYEDMNGDGRQYMPRNDLNEPSRAQLATGGGQSTNVYSGGVYELGTDEALVIEIHVPVEPAYSGFHLSNLWGESHDYANRLTSINGFQAERDPDGGIRYVVAHADPGVPNWLDTTGLDTGFMSLRWTYSTTPDELPTREVTKVRFDDIRGHLPPETRVVTAEERRKQIRIRQEHVQRRYRQS